MKNHCEAKGFGKEGNGTAARNERLESFIRDSGDTAYKFAYNLSGNPEDAKELVQQALYRATRAWGRYDDNQPLKNWFLTILRNAFYDSKKRYELKHCVSLDQSLGEDEEGTCYQDIIPDPRENLAGEFERREKVAAVKRALGRLSPQNKEILRLSDLDGMHYNDIARNLGIARGTVASRICRARQAFRKQSPELAALA
jgi:RNA polymerase sigma-70 factor (ECF subfamily)